MNIYGRVGWRAAAAVNPSSGQDADAQAFITAASITDSTQQSAINTLVTQLKTYGIWTKMKAVYPFVGGTAAQHKFNLKDPRDLDAAFRLRFDGGGTHSSTGYLPNGINSSALTFLSPSANQTLTSAHFSLYSRTSGKSLSTSYYAASGCYNSASNASYIITNRYIDNTIGGPMWSESGGGVVATVASTPDGRGFWMTSRTANNALNFYKNGTSIISNTTTQSSTSLPTYAYRLGSINGTPTGEHDNKELAFASLGEGLSSTESANFYTAVQTFQSTLGRAV
jgi:hypothetical protein